MHLTETPDGELLIHCYAGCDSAEILRELRRRAGLDTPRRQRETGLTLQQYAEAKQLNADSLRSWGVSDAMYDGKPALRIEYRDTQRKREARATPPRRGTGAPARAPWHGQSCPCSA